MFLEKVGLPLSSAPLQMNCSNFMTPDSGYALVSCLVNAFTVFYFTLFLCKAEADLYCKCCK